MLACNPSDVPLKRRCCIVRITFGNHIVAFKYRVCLLSTDQHDYPFGHPSTCQIPGAGSPESQLMGAVAQYEKAIIVIKLRGARERTKARTGRCEGRKPFGYYAGEKATLERMAALRASGLEFFDRLAAKLDSEGFRTRKGTAWQGKSINRILARQKAPETARNERRKRRFGAPSVRNPLAQN